jgi:hypothetical protein
MFIRKNSLGGIHHSGLLSFWTLTIILYSQEYNIPETGCFHTLEKGCEEPSPLGSKELMSVTENGTHNENNEESLSRLSQKTVGFFIPK